MLPHLIQVARRQHARRDFPIRFHYDYLGAGWNVAAKRVGTRRRSPYHTRHTFACWLLMTGASPVFIASQMEHETAQMVYETYGMWTNDMSDEQVVMLNTQSS